MGAIKVGDDWSGQIMTGDCSSNSSNDADQCNTMQSCMQLFPLRPAEMLHGKSLYSSSNGMVLKEDAELAEAY